MEALFTHTQHIRDVCHREEFLHVGKAVRLCEAIRIFRIDLRLARLLAGHLQEADKLLFTASALRNLDHLVKVSWVLCTHVRIDGILHTQAIELRLS